MLDMLKEVSASGIDMKILPVLLQCELQSERKGEMGSVVQKK